MYHYRLGSRDIFPTLQPCDFGLVYLWGALTKALSLARTCVSKSRKLILGLATMSVCGSCSTLDRSFDSRYMQLYHLNDGSFRNTGRLGFIPRCENITTTMDLHWGGGLGTIHDILILWATFMLSGQKDPPESLTSIVTTIRSSGRQI